MLVAGGYGDVVHRNLPLVNHLAFFSIFSTWVTLHGTDWFVRCGVSANTRVGTRFGTGNDRSTYTAWGSSEAFVCLFVAVFLHILWFHQFWGVSLTDPLTPA